jgi:hypothetical protein
MERHSQGFMGWFLKENNGPKQMDGLLIDLENVQMNKKKKGRIYRMLLVQIGCEGTYWLVCIDTQIPQLLKGGTIR